ncbi:MAG: (2Fe-2S)-binding protein [Oscillospiraceae bacterium]|jgi:NAD(P)H-nitrite reductase large subunit|nr:(2Fe-2S)-binding protein [Oscillospiraceae bacterium]
MDKVTDRSPVGGEFEPAPDDGLIICRCEEITKGEIRRAVYDGMYTLAEVRRYLRAGMGLCQGQTCRRLVMGIMAKQLNIPPDEQEPEVSRAPARPVEMRALANTTWEGVGGL